jgi:hypothetical protein
MSNEEEDTCVSDEEEDTRYVLSLSLQVLFLFNESKETY